MRRSGKYFIVLTTAPNQKTARALARAALQNRLIACANLIPKIESHYWWRGRMETSAEVLILMKTTRMRLTALEKLIMTEHPYDTPEFVVLPLTSGNSRYLAWLDDSVS